MKPLAKRPSRGSTATADEQTKTRRGTVLGSIPGLERLLPGHYIPGDPVRSRFGLGTLPRSYKGRPISLIINGTMFG